MHQGYVFLSAKSMPSAQRSKNDAIGIEVCCDIAPFFQRFGILKRQRGAQGLPVGQRHQNFALLCAALNVANTAGELVVSGSG